MQTLVNVVSNVVGLPSLSKTVFKYLLIQRPKEEDIPVATQCFDVEKVYLRPTDTLLSQGGDHPSKDPDMVTTPQLSDDWEVEYSFIRKRSQGGINVYGMTTVVHRKLDGSRMELKRIISAREYSHTKIANADPERNVVQQRRICFLWENASYHIHHYISPIDEFDILHVQTEGSNDFEVPPFLKLGPPISDDGDMSAFKISLKQPNTPSSTPTREMMK